jgi:hypothetical protein
MGQVKGFVAHDFNSAAAVSGPTTLALVEF